MSISEYVGIIKDIIVGLSALFAAVFAFQGLTVWRKELKGKSEYQLAKEVLKSVYRVREAFKQVRSPAIFQSDFPEDLLDDRGYLKKGSEYQGTAHVYEKRWKILSEAFRDLEEHHLEAQVEWGSKFQDVITKLRSCKGELMVAIDQMLERKKNPNDEMPLSIEELATQRSTLYYHGSDRTNDKFTPQIDDAIDEFERWLRPHIRR